MIILVAVEGLDGAGKNTLTNRLQEICCSKGLRVSSVSYPRYNKNCFAQLASQCLMGGFPQILNNPQAMALLFAADRQAGNSELGKLLSENDIVFADRYVASNFAYTAARLSITNLDQIEWLADIEFGELGVKKPDLQIFLDVSVSQAHAQRIKRVSSVNQEEDIYETNHNLQKTVWYWYDTMCEDSWISPWERINCGETKCSSPRMTHNTDDMSHSDSFSHRYVQLSQQIIDMIR